MATIQGNRVALEDVFLHIFPAQASIEHVQEPIGMGRDPFLIIDSEAGSSWKKIDCQGYEVMFLAGDAIQQIGGSPAYVRFGQQGPSDITSATPSGIPVLAGTKIKVPQGFKFLYFLPSPDTNWKIVITKIPCVETNYGPYAWTFPPDRLISYDGHSPPAGAYTVGSPSGLTDTLEIEVPSTAKKMMLRFVRVDGLGHAERIDAAHSGPLQIWLWPSNLNYPLIMGGWSFWSHNPADDWVTGQKGELSEQHDTELYELNGIYKFTVTDPTGWTAGVADSITFEAQFLG